MLLSLQQTLMVKYEKTQLYSHPHKKQKNYFIVSKKGNLR